MKEPPDTITINGRAHCCDRALFEFVNRALNQFGLQASITEPGDMVSFRIDPRPNSGGSVVRPTADFHPIITEDLGRM
jgi:hypothetical protein